VEATSALAGFHVVALSWPNWNLECWFLWREENPQNKARVNNKLNLCLEPGWNPMQATLMRGKHSHLRVTPAVFWAHESSWTVLNFFQCSSNVLPMFNLIFCYQTSWLGKILSNIFFSFLEIQQIIPVKELSGNEEDHILVSQNWKVTGNQCYLYVFYFVVVLFSILGVFSSLAHYLY